MEIDMPLGKKTLNRDETENLAYLLLGAAYADKQIDNVEIMSIRMILGDLLGNAVLPPWLETHIDNFDPKVFDLKECCISLFKYNKPDSKLLLDLLSKITDSNGVHDLQEGSYLLKVAKYIKASPELYDNLALEIIESENLRSLK
jgi:uncharacterized tellurite resistance protein B-like protein